ncbi:FAD-binding protein [Nonomuraea sp. NN258]|uniref:FAD-dependent monooxygenase n=1 Tax=Nonomuraea antri TaxID=2730852 RepID=UPI0015680F7A|nr:FAD-dependent monooxygenase [Nonomuraea antri]NRQ38621.1 FAD-binding protein [Nonomuraea antri]
MGDPVVISGGGPAGLMLAYELAKAGVGCVVLEKLTDTSDYCPGQGLNTTAVELLEQRGLLDGLLEHRDQSETKGTHFAMLWLDDSPLEGRHRTGTLIGQQHLERHLERQAVALGADLRRGHELREYTQDDDGVDLTVRGPAGEYSLRAAYLVGADGVDSLVRRLAGIDFPGAGDPCYGLVGDVEISMSELAEVHQRPRFSPTGGMYSAVATSPGVVRVITAEFGVDLPDGDPTAAELRERVRVLNGEAFPEAPVRWVRRYGGPTRNAERYRYGRVFLAGDAAHTFFPLAGLRLNGCLQDAVNLGWKLAASVRGQAPRALLDTYHAERHPAGAQAGAATDAQLALIHPARKVAPLRALMQELLRHPEVNRHLLGLSTGLSVSYADGPGLVGRRLPHVELKTATEVTSVPALLHACRGVLLDFTGDHAAAADGWRDRVDVVVAEPCEAIDASAVLIRPDGHVAWAAGAGELRAALGTWFGDPR